MKKGLKLSKKELEELYLEKKLSLSEIGKKYKCNGSNILYWLRKHGIKRRPPDYRKIHIPRETLEDLYWNKGLKPREIAQRFGIKNERTVRKKLEKYGIKRKTVSEALTKKFKAPFKENLVEKAYLLGLRTGDFHAKWARKSVRIQTSTTHPALIDLLKDTIKDYGEQKTYLFDNKKRSKEWFIYADLDSSFDFLIKKPDEIPSWILEDNLLFFNFFAAYMDCEGSFNLIKSHERSIRLIFRVSSGDKSVLEQTKEKLESLGFTPRLYIKSLKGHITPYGKCSKDIYELVLYQKKDVIKFIKTISPHSRHSEKLRKMNFIMGVKNELLHENVIEGWNKIRKEIKKEILS